MSHTDATLHHDEPDHTSTGKDHFEVLDGLRGSAAILVVCFHIMSMATAIDSPLNVLHHAYLAVDFFFGLSGFVIAYAYDDRRQALSAGQFFLIRIVRLHPLVILGTLLGLLSFAFDPFAGDSQRTTPQTLVVALVLALLLMPSKALPNRWGDTHGLNGPAWSLFQEYIGNIIYALFLRHVGTRLLAFLAVCAGAALVIVAYGQDTLNRGWGWDNIGIGAVRMAFSFITGLWLYRVRDRLPKLDLNWVVLTLVLAAAFMVPNQAALGGFKLNGLYDAAMVIVLFPWIIVAGSYARPHGAMLDLCKLAGRISYPLYITHYPFLYVFLNYVSLAKPPPAVTTAVGLGLLPFLLLCAWLFVKFWDEPLRTALRRTLGLSTPKA